MAIKKLLFIFDLIIIIAHYYITKYWTI